jgi:hypothetical protein
MSTKELIQAEIDPLSDEELDELYTLIKNSTVVFCHGWRPYDTLRPSSTPA